MNPLATCKLTVIFKTIKTHAADCLMSKSNFRMVLLPITLALGLTDQLRAGDTLVVWKLDRLSRSLKDLLTILERVDAIGAKFRSLTESIDTSGPAGRMLMQMLGSFAEFERAMIRERTRAGLHEARARGRVPGRKPKVTAEQQKEIVEAVSSGRKTAAEVARLFKVHRGTISRIVSQARAGV